MFIILGVVASAFLENKQEGSKILTHTENTHTLSHYGAVYRTIVTL